MIKITTLDNIFINIDLQIDKYYEVNNYSCFLLWNGGILESCICSKLKRYWNPVSEPTNDWIHIIHESVSQRY